MAILYSTCSEYAWGEWINVEKMLMKWSAWMVDTEERFIPEKILGVELLHRRYGYKQLR